MLVEMFVFTFQLFIKMYWKRVEITFSGTNIGTITLAPKFSNVANEQEHVISISELVWVVCSLFSLIYVRICTELPKVY